MPKPLETAPANEPSDYVVYNESDGPFWNCEKDAVANIRYSETGVGSAEQCPSKTLIELFDQAVAKRGNKVVIRTENLPPLAPGQEPPAALPRNQWKSWTFKQYRTVVHNVAKAFMDLGLEQHDTVSVFGFNAPEWFFAALGAIHAGGKVAGIYPSDTAEQVQFKAFHSDTAVAVVENKLCFDKFKSVVEDLPYLKAIVCWAYDGGSDITREDGSVVNVLTFSDLVALGKTVEQGALEDRIAKIEPGMCAALIYTSGTTGRPKAVMISHDNLVFESASVLPYSGAVGKSNEEERLISYLPLSHVAGMMVDIICPILMSATMKGWCSVNFARPYDLKRGTLGQRLGAVEPTFFLGVPRVWEKIAEKLKAVGAQTTGLKKKLSTTAKKKGLEHQLALQLGGSGKSPSYGPLGIYKKLLGLIKGKLGLSKCKFAFAGAAPMTRETLMYFGALGININEVYGMSECTGATTWSFDDAHEWSTVGFELPGSEVRVFRVAEDGTKTECPRTDNILHASEEEQGEICFRGRHIMMGYLANPKLGDDHVAEIEEKNAATIDSEGWLHSGDKGAISTRGMVKITGRYKELIIGAGGENVAPVPIEDAIKARMPFVSNAMMVGDRRKFMAVLLTLKTQGATGELPGTSALDGPAKEYGETIEDACNNEALIEEITQQLKEIGDDGDVTPSNAARIQKFTILPLDFSVATDELTATLKLKRSVVADKYDDIIEAFYESKSVFVPYSTVGSYDVKGEADAEPQGSFKAAGNLDLAAEDDDEDESEDFAHDEEDNRAEVLA
ncbi:Long-chain-fatty-acid--CoA ligase ACSBG2, partial [Hondaea fermentalgiana]